MPNAFLLVFWNKILRKRFLAVLLQNTLTSQACQKAQKISLKVIIYFYYVTTTILKQKIIKNLHSYPKIL